MDAEARRAAMRVLEPFVGEWSVEAVFPDVDLGDMRGRTTFEWALDGTFLASRSEIPHPAAPDSIAVVGVDEDGGAFTQHYFDSRGIARLYAMTFDGRVWTLRRESADFSPLPFAQRFTGLLADDGATIRGAWETAKQPGAPWELDFDLVYTRVA